MNATLTTPAGKVRTQTQCRYVLVRWTSRDDGSTSPPRIHKRSDTLQTLVTERRRRQGRSCQFFLIFDTTTKEQIS